MTPEAKAKAKATRQKNAAKKANMSKTLYCEECCTYFKMTEDGRWKKTYSDQYADLIADSYLECTCGYKLATKIKSPVVIGEFVALN